ncbi:hypothetical protein F0L68_06310 [Solihabitans fulvus]|uniref:Excreted virulence factor EspC, type VII ESX diderm n=1 Tax=Solihabitans fulvus TaxID=1892852 RepID=A0A5B2XNZ9_9PSEU|nr:type VII secretion target [Solihabitans fulvus]KAA2264700.1 hypothetical protein F0L68_06310 [Solihabitans fulvus]
MNSWVEQRGGVSPVRAHQLRPARKPGAVRVDPDWVVGYAKKVDEAAQDIDTARKALGEAPLRAESFGELGRTLRTADSYAKAADVLRQQLARAAEVLTSAGTGLRAVAHHYGAHDEEAARAITKADHRA